VSTPTIPLSRNRNYHILWGSQLLSELTGEIVQVAFPLLLFTLAGSPLRIGVVSAVLMAAHMAAVVPAGIVADRWDRKKVMVACMGLRAVVMSGLAVAVANGQWGFPLLIAVAVAEGALGSVFDPAEHAALPQVVPQTQLAQAVARNSARPFVATLAGPAVAGFLFTLRPVTPFAVAAVLLAVSLVSLLFLRLPSREPSIVDSEPAVTAGFRWLLGQRLLRATLLWMVLCNMVLSALVVIVLADSGESQVGAGEVGLTMACLGAGGVLGGVFADRLRAALPPSVLLLGFSWVAPVLVALMAAVPAGLPLGGLLGAVMFLVPVANATVMTYQLVHTPDGLRGRLSSVVGFCTGGAGALGPLVGGLLAGQNPGVGMVVCALAFLVLAVGVTANPGLRGFPREPAEIRD